MRKQILALVALVSFGAQAQEYNKWSIDLNGGVNKPAVGLTTGYRTDLLNFWTANVGVRYMANNKFGIRLGGGYDSFQDGKDSNEFKSNIWNVNLQGVINVGRVLNFETWTRDLGVLAHAGFGYSQLNSDDLGGADHIGFLTAGLTPQLRLSNRITLLADASVFFNSRQQNTYDTKSLTTRRGFQGVHFTGTLGLQIALGKQAVHADWFYGEDKRIKELEDRIAKAETDVQNALKKLDDKADKMIDANNNNIPDELENYLNQKFGNKAGESYASGDAARELIEKGYINVYFDFNASTPQKYSLWAADFVANFLAKNPSANINIVGYADEIGGENYNQKLSAKRADAVKKLLTDRGVDASRLTFEGKGEDKSVNKNSSNARQLARRATFEIK
ncbi:MAG: OmpA family protein [Capnocytophaga sp.]|nr:OmpA family protein [Capnocytophaga sp.]